MLGMLLHVQANGRCRSGDGYSDLWSYTLDGMCTLTLLHDLVVRGGLCGEVAHHWFLHYLLLLLLLATLSFDQLIQAQLSLADNFGSHCITSFDWDWFLAVVVIVLRGQYEVNSPHLCCVLPFLRLGVQVCRVILVALLMKSSDLPIRLSFFLFAIATLVAYLTAQSIDVVVGAWHRNDVVQTGMMVQLRGSFKYRDDLFTVVIVIWIGRDIVKAGASHVKAQSHLWYALRMFLMRDPCLCWS